MSDELNTQKMLVSKIPNGTVIDKIPGGKSLQILKILGIKDEVENTIAVAIRVNSKSMKTKDIIKLKDRNLSIEELKKIWLIAPQSKISIINNYKVNEQFTLSDKHFSNEFEGVLQCNNPTCATNMNEPVVRQFYLMQRDPILVRCLYC
ncbi:MAG: aspartate carbamoyltransferase regulatory subunit, partial [Candidatus Heimdallarchaeota archaeon]|nr:aspartate carbamoyltransferase regulatory subunit [Candidatus Heimdallarchaeota archaeon]